FSYRRRHHPFPTRRSSDLEPKKPLLQRFEQRRVEAFRRFHLRRMAEIVELHQPRVADQSRRALVQLGIVAQALGQFGRSEVAARSEEHTSELQSREKLVCR